MKNRNFPFTIAFSFLLILISSVNCIAQQTQSPDTDPLSDFSQLIGGEWHLDNSFQTFEWGVGKLSVKAKSYFIVDGQAKLVSEGAWFWHPELKVIKGYFTAIDMPYSVFEYTTTFEGKKMINVLTTYSSTGASDTYEEKSKIMEGNYSRK